MIDMNQYLNIFIDTDYPDFIDKYLNTNTLNRLKHITQFCGCDYTNLYSPLFKYTRFDHSLVVAHMTWHFTHNKKVYRLFYLKLQQDPHCTLVTVFSSLHEYSGLYVCL